MSETIGVNVAKRAMNLEVSPQFDGYSAVRIYVGTDEEGNDIIYEAGNTNGRVLEVQNDFGTQQMANNILADIRGYQYQPLQADSALLNPAAEMGDGVTVNGVYTGIFARETTFGRLMASNIKAPTDDEIAHEYSTESATTDRAFSRFVRSTRASLTLTSTEISAEVERATSAEETLRTSLTQTADKIEAEVTRATEAEEELSSQLTLTASEISAQVTEVDGKKLDHTHENESFGWKLTSTSFSINSKDNTKVFYADEDGVKISGDAEVTGKITATSGYIGNGSQGFQIRASSITNGKESLDDDYNGVYIGTDGIALGKNFKVNSLGEVTASNLKLYGSLYFKNPEGGKDITFSAADVLRILEWVNGSGSQWDWSTGTVAEGYDGWNTTYGTVFPEDDGGAKKWNGTAGIVDEGHEKWDNAVNWINAAETDVINLNNVYASGFYGDVYGEHYYPGTYNYIQTYLATAEIEGYGTLHYVTW